MVLLPRLLFAVLFVLAGLVPIGAMPMLLVDRDTLQVLHAQEAGQPWHPASLTKLMTAYVVFEEIARGTVTLETPVILSKKAVGVVPARSGLEEGGTVSLKDALYILIVKSANDMAVALAETVGGTQENFVAKMNDAARRMGLTATHFVNPHGLHDPAQVTTARDVAIIALYIEQSFPAYMPIFSTGVVRLGPRRLESQNELLSGFAGTIGMKTGYVCAAGLNLVAAVDRSGRRLLAVVLGAPSSRERNERTAELFLKGFSGSARPSGQTVLSLGNAIGAAPTDMRARVCGKEAADYKQAREAAFPMGLDGEPSYLTDQIALREYVARDLGRVRAGIPSPRSRPPHDPVSSVAADPAPALSPGALTLSNGDIPFPLPRPQF